MAHEDAIAAATQVTQHLIDTGMAQALGEAVAKGLAQGLLEWRGQIDVLPTSEPPSPGNWKVRAGGKYGSVASDTCPPGCGCKPDDLEAYGGHMIAESIAPRDRPWIAAVPSLIRRNAQLVAIAEATLRFVSDVLEYQFNEHDDDTEREVLQRIEARARWLAKEYGYDGDEWATVARARLPQTASELVERAAFDDLLAAAKLAAEHHQGFHSEVGIALRNAIAKAEGRQIDDRAAGKAVP